MLMHQSFGMMRGTENPSQHIPGPSLPCSGNLCRQAPKRQMTNA